MIPEPITYRKAGVDIALADRLVEHIRRKAPAIGGFSGLYPFPGSKDRFLAATTDGVGTKLKLAFLLDRHETVGIDLVAMCANDLTAVGAKPLFFLDYYATGRLDLGRSKRILAGILKGCRQAGMALLGGETAEMPGFYPKGEYDLAGFAVGLVDKARLADGSRIRPGDWLIGLPSNGVHSNGFSLIRRVFSEADLKEMGTEFLRPTLIYGPQVERLQAALARRGAAVLGMAHITGGGLVENLPRILPKGTSALVAKDSLGTQPVFRRIQRAGRVPEAEMYRTFNMGIGFVLAVRKQEAPSVLGALKGARQIGEVLAGGRRDVVLF